MFFLQPQYAYTKGTNLNAGPFNGNEGVFNLNPPDFYQAKSFQIVRAQAMVRGNIPGTEGAINYFAMVDAGDNLVMGSERSTTSPTNLQLTDASLTLNYVPGVRARIGQFITPSANEMLKPVHEFDFVNFSNYAIFTLLDWQMQTPGNGTTDNRPNRPNAGFRDIGLMLFDKFDFGISTHSYALMIGNGDGLVRWESDGHSDIYWRYRFGLQFSPENSFEFVTWGIAGNRDFLDGGLVKTYKRQRHGVDLNAGLGPLRIDVGYGYADGSIFHGTLGAGQPGVINGASQMASFLTLPNENARGYQLAVNYSYAENWTSGVRYDWVDYGLRNPVNQRRFSTLTLSAQYKFDKDKPTRLILNYEFKKAEAPELSESSPINQFLGGVDDRVSLNLFWFL